MATYTTDEERAEAACLASEPSDEGRETSLRDEAHHGRSVKYMPPGSVEQEATRPVGGGGSAEGSDASRQTGGDAPKKTSHQEHHPHHHTGKTAEDIATHDRELYGVRDSTKLDSAVTGAGRHTSSETPARVRDSTMRS